MSKKTALGEGCGGDGWEWKAEGLRKNKKKKENS